MAEEITANQFDAWLEGATLAEGSVEILQNPALLGRWADLERRYQRAQSAPAATERGIDDPDPLADLRAEAESLLAEIEASRTVLHVRALLPEDVDAILAAHPITPGPQFRGKIPSIQPSPTEAQAKAFLGMYDSYQAQLERWKSDEAAQIDAHQKATLDALRAQGAEKVARAVTRIEQGGTVVAERITAEQVLQLARRIGDVQLHKITAEIDRVSESAPEVPAGFLSRSFDGGPS